LSAVARKDAPVKWSDLPGKRSAFSMWGHQGSAENVLADCRPLINDMETPETGQALLRPGLSAATVMLEIVPVVDDLHVEISLCLLMHPTLDIDRPDKDICLASWFYPCPIGEDDPSICEPEPERIDRVRFDQLAHGVYTFALAFLPEGLAPGRPPVAGDIPLIPVGGTPRSPLHKGKNRAFELSPILLGNCGLCREGLGLVEFDHRHPCPFHSIGIRKVDKCLIVKCQ